MHAKLEHAVHAEMLNLLSELLLAVEEPPMITGAADSVFRVVKVARVEDLNGGTIDETVMPSDVFVMEEAVGETDTPGGI